MIHRAEKQIYKSFAGHISLPFMSIPLNTHLLQSSLPQCVFGTSSHAYISKFTSLLWLAGERETFPRRSGVRGKMCAQGDAKSFRQVLCVLTDFAEGFCSDLSQTWYWQMLCKLPTQHWQCLLELTRDHCPSLTPLPSPLSAQDSVYLEQRELSLPDCVVVLWCEQMGLGGQATSVPWILPPSQLFANGWELWEAGKLWVWAQNVLFL